MSTAIIRRSQARSSLRENRAQAARRRPKSRSPDSRPASAHSINAPVASSSGNTNIVRKRKKTSSSTLIIPTIPHINASRLNQQSHTLDPEDEQSLQSQSLLRIRSKTKSPGSRQNADIGTDRGRPGLSSSGRKEKDRSRSRDQTRAYKGSASIDAMEADDESSTGYTGPLAFAEFNRLKAEVEKLKEVSLIQFSSLKLVSESVRSNWFTRRRRSTNRVKL
jgi:hypothetical protein